MDTGAALGGALVPGDVVLLVGGLGAGKTQLAKGVSQGLGIDDSVVSPTFNIALAYEGGRIPLMHLDLYRLEDATELEDIDFYGIVDEDAEHASLIEWADLFPDDMPEDALLIELERVDGDAGDGMRRIVATAQGARSRALLERWASALD